MERRKEVRHSIDREVVVLTRQAQSYAATAVEISLGGLRIRSSSALTPGIQVAIFVQPEDEVEMRGTVEWTLDTLDRGLSVYQMGISLESISHRGEKAHSVEERREMLRKLLPYLSAKARKRPTRP